MDANPIVYTRFKKSTHALSLRAAISLYKRTRDERKSNRPHKIQKNYLHIGKLYSGAHEVTRICHAEG